MSTASTKRAKILTEIVGTTRTIKKKLEVDESGAIPKIILKIGGMGRGDVKETAEFNRDCLIPYTQTTFPFFWVKQTKYKLIMAEGATKCKSFGKKEIEDENEKPSCTKDDVRRYGNATVLKQAGKGDKSENRMLIYIMLVGLIALGVINILIATGHLRI